MLEFTKKGHRRRSHLNPDAVINTEPEEQQGTQEESLKESIQRSWKPAVHQERQREKGI